MSRTARHNLMAGLAIFRIKSSEITQYRIAGLSGSLTNIFWALIEITVYTVFFTYASDRSVISTTVLTLKQTVSYVWLAQLLLIITPHNIDADILQKITSGDVGVELCRPMDLYVHWFSKTAGGRLVPLLWRGMPMIIAGLCMPAGYRLTGPASPAGFALMLLSCLSALLLCSAYGTLIAAIRLCVIWGDGPVYMIMLIGNVLSGGYLPLQLWPDFMQKFLFYQPFAGYLDIPLRMYLGTMPSERALIAISLQLGWTAFFIVLGRFVMNNRLRGIIIQGG